MYSSLFYMPGTLIGAFAVDYLGPKWTMISGLLAQAVIGFIMSGLYTQYVLDIGFLSFASLILTPTYSQLNEEHRSLRRCVRYFPLLRRIRSRQLSRYARSQVGPDRCAWSILWCCCCYRKGWCICGDLVFPTHHQG